MHIPSIATLKCFESAAKYQSFTLAAQELHMTQSAVSRQIKQLEEILEVKLFRRVGRQVSITQAGKTLASELSIDLDRLRQTLSKSALAGNQKTVLMIASLPTFANRWLIPRLPQYMRDYPNVEINISTRLEPFNLSEQGFDIAIHFGMRDWPGAKLTKLCEEEMIAVASPDFRDEYNIISPDTLHNVPLIHIDSRPNAWKDWFKSQGDETGNVYKGKKFDQFSMVIAATLASIGAALIPAYLIEKELANGTLVKLSDFSLSTANTYFIVTPQGSTNPQSLAFRNWVQSEISNRGSNTSTN